jgi:hypothetical protein
MPFSVAVFDHKLFFCAAAALPPARKPQELPMNRLLALLLLLCLATVLAAQQPPQPQPPEAPPRVDARKEVVVNWTLGDQAWVFRDILATYEPVKGYLDFQTGQAKVLAVWTLRLTRDMETGAVELQNRMPGSPFKISLLDADRVLIDDKIEPTITPITGKAGDSIELYVPLSPSQLKEVKTIRVERRGSNVGF